MFSPRKVLHEVAMLTNMIQLFHNICILNYLWHNLYAINILSDLLAKGRGGRKGDRPKTLCL